MSYLCLSITDSQGALCHALSATARRRGNNISYNCFVVRTVSVHICACIPVTGLNCYSNVLDFFEIIHKNIFHYFPMVLYILFLGRFVEPSWISHPSSRLSHTLGTLTSCRQQDMQSGISTYNNIPILLPLW